MRTFRATFDGRALIPEEGLYFPIGKPLELTVREVGEKEGDDKKVIIETDPVTGLPFFKCWAGTKMIKAEDIERAEEEFEDEEARRAWGLLPPESTCGNSPDQSTS